MSDPDQTDLVAPQREVQRLLGRCLLRLQQYEHLLKAMVATQELSTLPHTLDARNAEVRGKTLGLLIGRLLGDYIVSEASERSSRPHDPAEASECFHLHFRMQLNLPPDTYETFSAGLRGLVTLRNTLVHHFIDQYKLWTVDGCLDAQAALTKTYAEIDHQFEQLRTYAGYADEVKQRFASFLTSPVFLDMVVNGIDQDGRIHWPVAGIIGALRQAFRELSIEGWASVDAAARWVSENQPEQTPQKYGCARWRHVIHESGQFELSRFTHNGQFGAWFRMRPATSS